MRFLRIPTTLTDVAKRLLGKTPMQVAQSWLLQRSPNVLLISGASPIAHLRENLALENLILSNEILSELNELQKHNNN